MLITLVACSQHAATASSAKLVDFDDHGPRPPGISVDPVPQMPPRRSRAFAEQSLVVLQEPRHVEAARRVVRDFFEAVVHESEEGLDQVLSPQAWIETGNRGSRQRAQTFWRSRFSRLDYKRLQGKGVFRDSQLSVYDAKQAQKLADTRTLETKPKGEELLLIAPIVTPRLGNDRFFGEKIVFVLEPVQTRYQIILMFEDFKLR